MIKNLINYIEDKLKKINKIFQKFIGQEKEKIFFEKKIKLDKRKEEEGKKDFFNQYKKNIG